MFNKYIIIIDMYHLNQNNNNNQNNSYNNQIHSLEKANSLELNSIHNTNSNNSNNKYSNVKDLSIINMKLLKDGSIQDQQQRSIIKQDEVNTDSDNYMCKPKPEYFDSILDNIEPDKPDYYKNNNTSNINNTNNTDNTHSYNFNTRNINKINNNMNISFENNQKQDFNHEYLDIERSDDYSPSWRIECEKVEKKIAGKK